MHSNQEVYEIGYQLAIAAYAVYADELDYHDDAGELLPQFSDLPGKTQRAWRLASLYAFKAAQAGMLI